MGSGLILWLGENWGRGEEGGDGEGKKEEEGRENKKKGKGRGWGKEREEMKLFVWLLFTETIVGVNKYRLEKEEEVEVLSIDNSRVIAVQVYKSLYLLNTHTPLLCLPLQTLMSPTP